MRPWQTKVTGGVIRVWRKSSYSKGGGSACVEVALTVTGAAVRDSKNVSGPTIDFPVSEWQAFVASLAR